MNNFEKGKELENKSADRLDAVGVKNNKNGWVSQWNIYRVIVHCLFV